MIPAEYRSSFKIEKLNRNITKWGTYGKEGKDPLKWVLIKDLGNEHICNILKTQHHIGLKFEHFLIDELKLRLTKNEKEF